MMSLELRAIEADELDDFVRAMAIGFGEPADEHDLKYAHTTYRPECTNAMFDNGSIVGTSSALDLELVVEGLPLKAAGLTAVTVLPTHRRRGILTEMMRAQLEMAREREEQLMPFWVSETHIYQRFGADIAARMEDWTIDRRHTEFLRPMPDIGQVRLLDVDEARSVLPGIHRSASLLRNGGIPRTDAFAEASFMDPEKWREGFSSWFYAVHETDGVPDGYVKYRMNTRKGDLFIYEHMAATESAAQSLWQYCFGIDLIKTIKMENRPSDDALPWQLLEPRRLERKVAHDLWLRLVDIRQALALRPWQGEGRIIFEVEDSFCPWNAGRFALEFSPEGANTMDTREPADLACTANELACLYLGGVRPSTLAHAGRLSELTNGAIKHADKLFRPSRAPWANQEF